MRIWFQIWGSLPENVSTFILWHDAGELVTGDPPFPIKAKNPELKAIYDDLEAEAVHAMRGPSGVLLPFDKLRAKCCDIVEMYKFGLVELNLGNRFAWPIVTDTYEEIKALSAKLPAEDYVKLHRYVEVVTAALFVERI